MVRISYKFIHDVYSNSIDELIYGQYIPYVYKVFFKNLGSSLAIIAKKHDTYLRNPLICDKKCPRKRGHRAFHKIY